MSAGPEGRAGGGSDAAGGRADGDATDDAAGGRAGDAAGGRGGDAAGGGGDAAGGRAGDAAGGRGGDAAGGGGDAAGEAGGETGRAEGTFQIVNERGLHARAAIKLVQAAQRFPCEVTLKREDQSANGKSVMGVILLCSPKGAWLTVEAEGEGAAEAVGAIGAVIADRFGEGT